jgi:Asp-tRNA(Asn)/Glu-tRNA(Gln) amidotransferase A subunit family amidase
VKDAISLKNNMSENRLTIAQIQKKHRQGEFDLLEWNRVFIKAIEEKESRICAWEYIDKELWIKKCNALLNGPSPVFDKLYGVPVGVKDIFNTIDMPTQMGSALWKDFTPGNDARVVYDIKMNGGIIAGKTVTAEFAVHAPNATRNPWNREKSPGTSSSGSAAAVSAGMVPLAIGTQTAGSIIRPASYCGVFGFKPSFGTIPRTGMLKTTDSLDSVGLFATNTDDCRVLFDVMRVKGLDYPFVHKNLDNYKPEKKKKWKIGVLSDQLHVARTYPHYSQNGFSAFCDKLKRLDSIELVSPAFPELANEAHEIQRIIYHRSLSYYFKKEYQSKSFISEVMNEIVSEGNKISVDQYQEAISKQSKLSAQMDDLFSNVDIFITLSTAGTAPEFKTAIDPPDTCLIWTMCGLPTISIPAFEHAGLPFGLQLVAKRYSDYALLDLANVLTDAGLLPKFSTIK